MRPFAVALLAPALLLVTLALVAPLLLVVSTSVRDPDMAEALPRTALLLRGWDGGGLPPDAAFTTVARELAEADAAQHIGAVSARLNFAHTGLRSLVIRTAHGDLRDASRATLTAFDARWGSAETWRVLRQAAGPLTPLFLLRALDFDLTPAGRVVPVPTGEAIFRTLFARTLAICAEVTFLTLLVAYPVAHVLATLRGRWARIATAMVMIPFWTSIMVRTTAWFIVLQREGPVNAVLRALGLTHAPVQLIFTRLAVIVAMVHVLLPFAILPIAAVMRRIDPVLLRAAASLGASGPQRLWRVYLPLTMPGVAAAALITFMLALGFYVTPALVGGETDQMVSAFIARFVNETLNPGMAAALAVLLLAMTAGVVGVGRLMVPTRNA